MGTTSPQRSDPQTLESSEVAQARSAAYGLFARLTSSPHDAAASRCVLPPSDLREVARELARALPFALDLQPLVAAAAGAIGRGARNLGREYSALFEVGSEGAPAPIREDLAGGEAGVKEEIVRFYDFFGYELTPERQWAPDHLAVELEFLHFLAFRESRATASQAIESDAELSLRLAQRDFLSRHPLRWLPVLRAAIKTQTHTPYYPSLFDALHRFLTADLAWLTTQATQATEATQTTQTTELPRAAEPKEEG